MTFRDEVCVPCGGTRYPRQCRGSQPWREHKARTFSDLDRVDYTCPFGLPILPQAEAELKVGTGVIRIERDCKHGTRISCCKIECRNDEVIKLHEGLPPKLPNAHCGPERCRFYEIVST